MNEKDWIDFRQIKDQIPIEQVLGHYGVMLRPMGGELRGRCALPTHTSQNSNNSFSVNREQNVWCCQSVSCMDARDGRLGGTVLDFVAIMERCSVRDAAVRLRDWFGETDIHCNRRVKSLKLSRPDPDRPLPFHLQGIDHAHRYLAERGVSTSTARAFGIGFYGGPGIMHGRVVIPIRNEKHDLLAYAGRAINGEDPKYRFPSGFHKSQVLFNLNRAKQGPNGTVILVEGFFDVLKVFQAGHSNVVALMGSSLSEDQRHLLQKHFSRAVLMLDGDEAGQRAATLIGNRLVEVKMNVSTITLPPGQQPDQLASKELNQLFRGYISDRRGLER
jgi:DNA primase